MTLAKWYRRMYLGFRSSPRRSPRGGRRPTHRPVVENLEDRVVPSTINWANRGNATFDTDNFNRSYGANAAAARSVVDAVLSTWQNVIDDFNYRNVGRPGWAPLNNHYDIVISAANLTSCGGVSGGGILGCGGPGLVDPDGKPFNGALQLDDDGAGGGWYFDPNPRDHSEFTRLASRFAASGTMSGTDFYSVALHEIGHDLGISNANGLAINSRVSNPGLPAPYQDLRVYTFRDGSRASLTSDGHTWGGPTPPAGYPNHPNDLMNPSVGASTRRLVSDLDARILADAYGYAVRYPSNIETFLANFNRSTGALTVNPDPQLTSNAITLDRVNDNLRVNVAGVEAQFPRASVTSVTVAVSAAVSPATEVVNVDDTADRSTEVKLGTGSNTVNVSPLARKLGNIRSQIKVTAGSGTDQVVLSDDNNTGTDTYTVTSTGVRLASASAFALDYNAATNFVQLNAGSGTKTANVQGTAAGVAVTVRGADTVNVGSSGSMQSVQGNLVVDNPTRRTALNLANGADSLSHVVGITSFSVTGLAPAMISFVPAALRALTIDQGGGLIGGSTFTVTSTIPGQTVLNCGAGRDTVNVQGTSGPLTVNGQGGDDTITVSGGGTFSGALVISGQGGNDTLTLDDRATTTNQSYSLDASGTTAYLSRGPLLVTYDTVERLVINAGSGNDTFILVGTLAGTTSTFNGGGGADVFYAGGMSTQALAGFQGNLVVNGEGGTDTLYVNDQRTTTAQTYTVGSAIVSRSAVGATITYGTVETLAVNGGSGNETVNVQGTAAAVTTQVNGGSGNDTFNLGSATANPLGGILGPVQFAGGAGTDTLNVNAQTATAAQTYNLGDGTFDGGGSAPVTYAALEGVTLNGGGGGNTVEIIGTTPFVTTTVNAGTGNDTVNVGTRGRQDLRLLSLIRGPLQVNGQGGIDALNLNDQAATNGRTYSLFAGRFVGAPAQISWTTVEGATFNGGGGGNEVNVLATDFATPLTVNAGTGDDFIWVGDRAGGTFTDIRGDVTVNGQGGTDTLTLDDRATTSGQFYTIDNASVLLGVGRRTVRYAGLERLVFNGGSGGDSLAVWSTAAGTPVSVNTGGGDDTISVGTGANTLDGVRAEVSINGGSGSNSLTLYDTAAPSGGRYTLSPAGSVTRSGAATVRYGSVGMPSIQGGNGFQTLDLSAYTTDLVFNVHSTSGEVTGDVAGVVTFRRISGLVGGSGNDRFVFADGAGLSGGSDGGGGVNTLDESAQTGDLVFNLYTNAGGDVGNVNGGTIFGNITNLIGGQGNDRFTFSRDAGLIYNLDGQGGTNTLDLSSRAEDLGFALTGSDAGTVNGMAFASLQNLTAGGGNNQFVFDDGAGVAGTIDGGTGSATLDYSAYTASIIVDLQTGQATGVGAVVNIQNVLGGNGGPAGSNYLQGGTGRRNILIAGYAAGTLVGGDDEDLLIGGSTAYDTDLASLQAIAAEWARADEDYDTRVFNLSTGTGVPLLDATTVFGNGGGNGLYGGAGRDWFFGNPDLDGHDWDPDTETFTTV